MIAALLASSVAGSAVSRLSKIFLQCNPRISDHPLYAQVLSNKQEAQVVAVADKVAWQCRQHVVAQIPADNAASQQPASPPAAHSQRAERRAIGKCLNAGELVGVQVAVVPASGERQSKQAASHHCTRTLFAAQWPRQRILTATM